jgi:predicted dehydrogenase
MGTNQHLVRSVLAIMKDGGVALKDGTRIMPDPILVGRNAQKIEALAKQHGVKRWTTDLNKALADKDDAIFFDSGTTQMRPELLTKAIKAGKHIYCEKPIATDLKAALKVCALAKKSGLKNGVVQDKLFLPGLLKLKELRDKGFYGRMINVQVDFGYWVFPGDDPNQPPQRPSWNYRAQDGGGIILDMVCHWRYVLDNLFGEVKSVSCIGATQIPSRVDEAGKTYKATADDAAYATFELAGGVLAHINMQWTTRVYRDDLVTFQVNGTEGSAIAGLTECMMQARKDTPRPVWNPDQKRTDDFRAGWTKMPDRNYDNGFKVQWEMFIRHVMENAPYKYDLVEGAKGVQLVEAALRSWKQRRIVDVPKLALPSALNKKAAPKKSKPAKKKAKATKRGRR